MLASAHGAAPLLSLLIHNLTAVLVDGSTSDTAPPTTSSSTRSERIPIPEGIVFGTAWRGDATATMAWAAFNAGFRAFDTANQPCHYNESALGDVVRMAADNGVPRKDLWLQTKFTHPSGHSAPKQGSKEADGESPGPVSTPYNFSVSTEDQVQESFRSSLEHLGTSYVDALILHAPLGRGGQLADSDWRAWRSMETLALSGQARVLGVSNVNAAQLRLLLASRNASGNLDDTIRVRPALVQNRCWASRHWDVEVRSLCAEHGLIYQGFSLLSHGVNGQVLSGDKSHRLKTIAAKAHISDASPSRALTTEQVTAATQSHQICHKTGRNNNLFRVA